MQRTVLQRLLQQYTRNIQTSTRIRSTFIASNIRSSPYFSLMSQSSHSSAAPAATASTSAPSATPPSPDRSHMKLTAHIPRQKGLLPATIVSVEPLSDSINQLFLQVSRSDLEKARFMPGQWVDFHIPGVETIGGFSICSTPSLLEKELKLELAVKRSKHPPAAWVHQKAAAGVQVQIEIGGTFAYDPEGAQQKNPALFLVGGVGCTPIVSMVRQRMETQLAEQQKLDHSDSARFLDRMSALPSTTVIYSAKQEIDLIYRKDLEALRNRPHFQLYLSTTAGCSNKHAEAWKDDIMNLGRVPLALLQNTLETQRDSLHVYLCGPPAMVEELLPIVEKQIAKERIHYEKWW